MSTGPFFLGVAELAESLQACLNPLVNPYASTAQKLI